MATLEIMLHSLRQRLAATLGLPRYRLFNDAAIQWIASARPVTLQALASRFAALSRTPGISAEVCELCGREILELTRAATTAPARRARGQPTVRAASDSQVYILELEGGRVYVGKSSQPSRRYGQHAGGGGSVFTRMYPPTGRRLPRLGNVRGGTDAAERDETLRYMRARGIDLVRGWRYTSPTLSAEQSADAEANMRELFDLCRRCGRGGHFAASCPRS